MIFAVQERGAPWGIVALAGGAAAQDRAFPLAQYMAWLPWTLFGPFGGLLAVLALGSVLWLVVRTALAADPRRLATSDRDRFVLFATAIAGSQLLVYGTAIHAEPRYLMFPMTLLAYVGANVLVGLARRVAPARAVPLAVPVGLLLLVLGMAMSVGELRHRAAFWDWTRDVGTAIGAMADSECSVLTSDPPIVSWYSGCVAYNYAVNLGVNRLPLLTGEDRFMVLREDGLFQPSPEVIARTYLPSADLAAEFRDGFRQPAALLFRITDIRQ